MIRNMYTIKEQVMGLLKNLLEKEGYKDFLEINLDSDLADFGLNSLIFIKLVVELENQFKVTFDEDKLDYKKFLNLDELIRYVNLLCSRNHE